jgi:amino acid transporter
MLGASIYVVPFMIQRNVPGIGPYVIPAFLLAALPAVLAAFAYAILASAMPRAGGSYIYASRGLHPYLGFVASFSQWFGLSIAIGVVSYVIIPFVRDIAAALDYPTVAALLEQGGVRVTASLAVLWFFVWVNIRGVTLYERTLIPLMYLMFALGFIVIAVGFSTGPGVFAAALASKGMRSIPDAVATFDPFVFLSAAAVLFSSFIGFDSIAQAGGEAKNPNRNLPIAIALAVGTVGTFYILFSGAVYHAIPWQYVAQEAMKSDVTASGLMSVVLSPGWTVAIMAGAAVALTNDLPAMLLSVSRLMFAWAEDGIFPKQVTRVHTLGILGSHFAGDFFLGIDILVTSMLVNFLFMCLAVLTLPGRNPLLAADIRVVRSRRVQRVLGWSGVFTIAAFLIIHVIKDLSTPAEAWYFHSTPVWLMVMTVASLLYVRERRRLRSQGVDEHALFSTLPPE